MIDLVWKYTGSKVVHIELVEGRLTFCGRDTSSMDGREEWAGGAFPSNICAHCRDAVPDPQDDSLNKPRWSG